MPTAKPRALIRHPARIQRPGSVQVGLSAPEHGYGRSVEPPSIRFAGALLGLIMVSKVMEPIQKTLGMQAKCRMKQILILAPIRTRLQRASGAPPRSHPARSLVGRASAPSQAIPRVLR